MYHLAKSLYLNYTSKEEYSILLLGLDNAGKTTLLKQIRALYSPPLPPSSTTTTTTIKNPNPETETETDTKTETVHDLGATVPTVGQNVATVDLGDVYLKFWDVGGQQGLRRLWGRYYGSAHAVVFVVDSTDVGVDADVGRLGGDGEGGQRYGDQEGKERRGRGDEDEEVKAAAIHNTNNTTTTNNTTAKSKTYTHARTPSSTSTSALALAFSPLATGTRTSIGDAHHLGRLGECRVVLESVLHADDLVGIPILVLANKQDRDDSVEVVRIKEGFVRRVFEGDRGGMVRDSRVLPVSALAGTGVRDAVEWVRTRVLWNKEARRPVMR